MSEDERLPSLDELRAEEAAQAAGAAELRKINDLISAAEALPVAVAASVLQGLLDATGAYAGPLAKAVERLAWSGLRRLDERADR